MQSARKGRGAQHNPHNPFSRHTTQLETAYEHPESPDTAAMAQKAFAVHPKTIVNRVNSPDLSIDHSLNPYQGCSHGCAYCYARPTHEFWGYSAGLDFESTLLYKPDAPALLEKHFLKRGYRPEPIMLSGNTDCYQPLERRLGLTRQLLELFWAYRHPVGIITKNSLVLRDLDLLKQLASERLVKVAISLTTLNEDLRRHLEPRTATGQKRLEVVQQLRAAGVPVSVMVAPIIPGLNLSEVPTLIEQAARAGAQAAHYTVVRLNDTVGEVFRQWLQTHYPDRADKVWHQIQELHHGDVQDRQSGRRLRGEGHLATVIGQLVKTARRKHLGQAPALPDYNLAAFRRGGNLQLF